MKLEPQAHECPYCQKQCQGIAMISYSRRSYWPQYSNGYCLFMDSHNGYAICPFCDKLFSLNESIHSPKILLAKNIDWNAYKSSKIPPDENLRNFHRRFKGKELLTKYQDRFLNYLFPQESAQRSSLAKDLGLTEKFSNKTSLLPLFWENFLLERELKRQKKITGKRRVVDEDLKTGYHYDFYLKACDLLKNIRIGFSCITDKEHLLPKAYREVPKESQGRYSVVLLYIWFVDDILLNGKEITFHQKDFENALHEMIDLLEAEDKEADRNRGDEDRDDYHDKRDAEMRKNRILLLSEFKRRLGLFDEAGALLIDIAHDSDQEISAMAQEMLRRIELRDRNMFFLDPYGFLKKDGEADAASIA